MFTAAIKGMHLFLWKQSLLRLLLFLYSSIENYITCVRRMYVYNFFVCVYVCVCVLDACLEIDNRLSNLYMYVYNS